MINYKFNNSFEEIFKRLIKQKTFTMFRTIGLIQKTYLSNIRFKDSIKLKIVIILRPVI